MAREDKHSIIKYASFEVKEEAKCGPYCCSFVRHWAVEVYNLGCLWGLEYEGKQPILDPEETRMVDQTDVHGSAIEMVMQARFDWDAIDQEQESFEWDLTVFMWFRAEGSVWDRKRTLTILRIAEITPLSL